jgi:DNA-binding transcriptional regulator/RsmH inhibitor MraZ
MPAWRPLLEDEPIMLRLTQLEGLPGLMVLTEAAFQEKKAIINRMERPETDRRKRLGALAASCREASINEQGKLTIPKDLAERAGIQPEEEAEVVGRDGYFEVWKKTYADEIKIKEEALLAEDDL